MKGEKKSYSSEWKAKIALEAIKGQRTINEIASEYKIHPTQIMNWKKQALEQLPEIFSDKREKKLQGEEELKSKLYEQIGKLQVELEWLKKNLDLTVEQKRSIIEANNQEISLRRQYQLIGLSKASLYNKAKAESVENLAIMGLIDEIYTKWPFYRVRRIKVLLSKAGYKVNDKRVRRLMRKMGLQALYPKPKLSLAEAQNKVYPYLLKNLKIERVNQVWSTDITYVKLRQGFIYLVAIMNWYSRYVLAWEVSNTLDASFCISGLERALRIGKPEIFNSDQGSQFTSKEFTKVLIEQGISISKDGRGRAFERICLLKAFGAVSSTRKFIFLTTKICLWLFLV